MVSDDIYIGILIYQYAFFFDKCSTNMHYDCMQTPLLLEINTHQAKLRDIVDKVVKAKLGMTLPLIMHGPALLYEVGDDLDDDMVANYAANLEKV